jgi:hypothetical protein
MRDGQALASALSHNAPSDPEIEYADVDGRIWLGLKREGRRGNPHEAVRQAAVRLQPMPV